MIRVLALLCLGGVSLIGCAEPAPIAALPTEQPQAIDNAIVRHDVRFPCGGTRCAAWLYLPQSASPSPVVVMGNGFAGTRDVGLPYFADRFARAGFAVLAFDYRHFGASGGAPRQLVDPWRQLDDWKAALTFVRGDARLDGKRVALWGTSLGGGLALVAATRDANVQAVVAQIPQIDADAEAEATFPGAWWLTRLLFSAWGDLAMSAFTDEPLMIAAIAPHDGFGMLIDDKAYDAVDRLVPKGSTYRNEVAARSIFTFDDYNPRAMAAGLKAPVLLIASKADRFAAYSAVEAYAKSHPNARITTIEGDHFDAYAPPQASIAAQAAITFLKQTLRADGGS